MLAFDINSTTEMQTQRSCLLKNPSIDSITAQNTIKTNNSQNDEDIKSINEDEDDSFEYATDRESSVYNPTTLALRNSNNSRIKTKETNGMTKEELSLLDNNKQQIVPESRFSRWIPKDQRELLEKQAKLLANRIQPRTLQQPRATFTNTSHIPTETEI